MRLTLRTLLAYLDDILEPAQAKEIGEKISQSGYAGTLVNRIREVMRRRRLTTPGLESSENGVDLNRISEYLDNTLSPDGVADIEKVCLASDVHLAEVAACHQILTLVLGEPVDILPESRQRMYALGPLADSLKVESPLSTSDDVSTPEEDAPRPAQSFEQTIPEYLRKKPLWKRVLPYGVFLFLIGLFAGLIFTDPLFKSSGTDSSQTDQNSLAQTQQEKTVVIPFGQRGPLIAEPTRTEEPPPQEEPVIPDEPVVTATSETVSEPVVSQPMVEMPVPATVDPALPANQSPAPAEAPVPVPVIVQGPTVQYMTLAGIAFRHDEQEKDWLVLPPRSLIHPNDRIAAPEPFDADLDVEKGQYQIILRGGSSVRMLPPGKAGDFGLAIRRGRLVIHATGEAKPNPDRPDAAIAILGIAVNDELWRLELLNPGTICGIEIEPAQPFGLPAEPEEPVQQKHQDAYRGGLYVLKGSVRFSDGTGNVRIIQATPNGGWMSLIPSTRAEEANSATALSSIPVSIPEWLNTTRKRASSNAHLYRKEFPDAAMDLKDQQGLSLIVPAIVSDPRPRISELAVKSLVVTDSYAGLVKALTEADHEESRAAAIYGLRTWLLNSDANKNLLLEELEQYFLKEADVQAVARLLWGFTEADARDKITSYQLIGWLEHDHVAVRQLAFYHIYQLTGRKFDYGPIMPASQRRSAINRWISHVEKEGALISD